MEIITELKKFDCNFQDYRSIMRNFNFLSPVQDRILFTSSFECENYTVQYALRFKVFVPDYSGIFPQHGYEVKFYVKAYYYYDHDLENRHPEEKVYNLWKDCLSALGVSTYESIYNEVYPKIKQALNLMIDYCHQ